MPHIHERGEAARLERPQNSAVVFYLRFVELPFFRLDARPLNGEAVAGVAQRARDIEILLVAVVVIPCTPRDGRAARAARRRPVGVVDPALHLIGGGRRAPEKSVGKGLHVCNSSTAEKIPPDTDSHRESERKKGELKTFEKVPRGEARDTREYQERVRVHSPKYGTTREIPNSIILRVRSASDPRHFGAFPSGRATV